MVTALALLLIMVCLIDNGNISSETVLLPCNFTNFEVS